MSTAAKPALQPEPGTVANSEISLVSRTPRLAATPVLASVSSVPKIRPVPSEQPKKETSFQPRLPAITGEAHYRGSFPVNGIISGNLVATGSDMTVKKRTRHVAEEVREMDGEMIYKEMLRCNRHDG